MAKSQELWDIAKEYLVIWKLIAVFQIQLQEYYYTTIGRRSENKNYSLLFTKG